MTTDPTPATVTTTTTVTPPTPAVLPAEASYKVPDSVEVSIKQIPDSVLIQILTAIGNFIVAMAATYSGRKFLIPVLYAAFIFAVYDMKIDIPVIVLLAIAFLGGLFMCWEGYADVITRNKAQ